LPIKINFKNQQKTLGNFHFKEGQNKKN